MAPRPMASSPVRTSIEAVRRLAVAQQHLAGRRPGRATAERLVATIRDLPYVQWDPVSVVAPSHLLSLWARVGSFRIAEFERLLWTERRLLQHWIPFAAVVPTEDYPLFASYMRRYPGSLSDSWGGQRARARAFLAAHADLRERVLAELRDGPRTLNEFSDHARSKREAGDWEPASGVAELLWHLLMSGEVMVVGHRGNLNLWGLPEAFLPSWVDRRELTADEGEGAAARKALRALGVASPREVHLYFVRGCYRDVRATLRALLARGQVRPVVVDGLPSKEERYVLSENVDRLEELSEGALSPRVALLPPFDNMVCNGDRGRQLFDFGYVREQFLPKERRRFGMWVLPILRGERFVGRLDARLDKERRALEVLAVFAERYAPKERSVASEIREELERLAAFVGARSVTSTSRGPAAGRGAPR